jgi:hypothetical protein
MREFIDFQVKVVPVRGNFQEFSLNDDLPAMQYPDKIFWHFCLSDRPIWHKPNAQLDPILGKNQVAIKMREFYFSNFHPRFWKIGMSKEEYLQVFDPKSLTRQQFEKEWIYFQDIYNTLRTSAEKTVDLLLKDCETILSDILLESKVQIPEACFPNKNHG